MKSWIASSLLLVIGTGLASSAPAATRTPLVPPGHILEDVKLDMVTPHIAWANPRAAAPIRALFIGPAYGQRETAELAERLSLDFDVQFSGTTSSWTQLYLVEGQSRPQEILAKLRQKLSRPHDCIVIGNLDWDLLPQDVVETMFASVAKGSGLVYIMYSQAFPAPLLKLLDPEPAAPRLGSLVPIEALQGVMDRDGQPALSALPEVRCFRFGKGRITLIRYPGLPPEGVRFLTPDPNDPLAYEYCQALLAKCIIHTAGKAGPVTVASVAVPGQIDIDRVTASEVVVKCAAAPDQAAARVSATWIVRDIRGDPIAQQGRQVDLKAGELRLALPPTPEGLHFVDVMLRSADGKVLDWGSAAFRVISPISIAGIEFLNDTVPPPADIAGRVVISSPTPYASRPIPEDAIVRIKLLDNFGRLYAQGELPDPQYVKKLATFAQASMLWFSLPVEDSLSTINLARAELWQGDRLISVRQREFYVPRHPQGDFVIGVWGVAERVQRWSHIASLVCRRDRQLGIDASLIGHYYADPGSKYRMAAGITRAGLSTYPYIERISYFEYDPIRQPCLTDPTYLQRRMAEHRSWAHDLRKLGCIAFNLGDEVNLSAQGIDVCFSPSCQDDFRQWLKRSYGTLEKLNDSWGSAYKDWSEIHPTTRAEAEKSGNRVPWLDHRLHMTDVMMNFMAQVSGTIQQEVPGARCGPEGIWGTDPYYGVDWGQLTERLGVALPYMDEPLAFLAACSLARPEAMSGTWMGGYPHRGAYEGMARYDPWYALLHGLNSAWFYVDYDGAAMIHPYDALAPDFRLNRAGSWFFQEASRIKSGVGKLVLASRRQRDGIAILYSSPSCYLQPTTANDMILAFRDAGFGTDVITSPQLAAGGLEKQRILLLAQAVAMSEAECAAVHRFVEKGGIVIADALPATHTDHGKKLAQSPLADLFAKPGVVNATGSGRALLLDAGIENYAEERQYARKPEVPRRIRQLLKEMSIEPAVMVEAADREELIQGLEVLRHGFAGGQMLSILREELAGAENPPRQLTLHLPKKQFAIDLRTGRQLGMIDRLAVNVPTGPALLYALLDQEPGKLAIEAPAQAAAGAVVEVKLRTSGTPFNVCHVEFRRPDGSVADEYTVNAVANDGLATVQRKLALNEQAGGWKILASDVLTGQRVEAQLTIGK